jgi:hypothetical protein
MFTKTIFPLSTDYGEFFITSMVDSIESKVDSNSIERLTSLNFANMPQIKTNWELIMYQISQYQKNKFMNSGEDTLIENDIDMIRWVYKIFTIIKAIHGSKIISKIVSKDDEKILKELFQLFDLQNKEEE